MGYIWANKWNMKYFQGLLVLCFCISGSDICADQEDHPEDPSHLVAHGHCHRVSYGHCYGGTASLCQAVKYIKKAVHPELDVFQTSNCEIQQEWR